MAVSVTISDPGGWSDSFCQVMANVTRDKILLTDAVFWNKKIFPRLTNKQIKDDIKKLDDHFEFDYHLCETNNQGHMVISDLRSPPYNLHVTGITTSSNLKLSKTIRKGASLDKDKTVPYLIKFIEEGIIELPINPTPGLKKGIEELKNYGVSKSGKYQALTGHDDFVSCLVILVHWAKRTMLKSMAGNLIGVGADPNTNPDYSSTNLSDEQQAENVIKKRFQDNFGVEPDKIDITFPS